MVVQDDVMHHTDGIEGRMFSLICDLIKWESLTPTQEKMRRLPSGRSPAQRGDSMRVGALFNDENPVASRTKGNLLQNACLA